MTPAQSAGSIPAITAAEVATITHALSGSMAIAAGRAWWAPAAGDIVFWAVTVTSQDGQTVRTAYGAAGPAPTLEAAQMLGAGALHQQAYALDADQRQADQKADRVARLQALAAANPGIRPWSSDR